VRYSWQREKLRQTLPVGNYAGLCCSTHGLRCEPPRTMCCRQCTEWQHPQHKDGSVCSNPDPSWLRL
jgi:hypothetical protein